MMEAASCMHSTNEMAQGLRGLWLESTLILLDHNRSGATKICIPEGTNSSLGSIMDTQSMFMIFS